MTRPIAMITGGNRGIGLAIARELAARGHQLSLGLRDPDSLPEELKAGDPIVVAYDATDAKAARRFVDATLEAAGRIDVLVNNAGTARDLKLMPEPPQDDEEMEEALDALLQINVKAPFRLTRAALPALCRSGRGRVITLASLSGKRVLGLGAELSHGRICKWAQQRARRRQAHRPPARVAYEASCGFAT